MIFVALIIFLALLLYAPSFWVSRVLAVNSEEQAHFPGTGGEFAQHLLDRLGLTNISVEVTTLGDHYDPMRKAIGLSESNMNGKSLAAITTACHEVGHAIQDQRNERLFRLRITLTEHASVVQKAGSIFMMLAPVVAVITRAPAPGLVVFSVGLLAVATMLVVHVITLPVEWDASFNKAMPLLRAGDYLTEDELRQAEKILKACALTYLAGSLASLLNVWRWLRLLSRR